MADNDSLTTASWNDNQTDSNCSEAEISNFTGSTAGLFAVVPLIRVVGSELERVLFQLYLGLNISWAALLNSLVLLAIARDRRLYKPENVIIGFDAVNNIIMVFSGSTYMLWFISQDSLNVEYYYCQIAGFLGSAAFILTSHIIALLCFERYYFLCHPISYPKRITIKRALIAIVVIQSIALVDIGLASMPDRVLIVTFMMCTNRDPMMVTLVNVIIYLLVATGMAIFSVIKIKGLTKRTVGTTSGQMYKEKEKQRKRQVSAIKTIILVSGFYFVMYAPMGMMRLLLFLGGVTPVDLEFRRQPSITLLLRWNTIAMSGTTPVVNPILYLTTRKPLKNSVLQMFPFLRCRKNPRVGTITATTSQPRS